MCISSCARTGGKLAQCFDTVLGSPVRTVEFPGIDQPILVVSFPGGDISASSSPNDAPDDEQSRLGAWLELRADDPAAVLQATLAADLPRSSTWGIPITS